MLNSIFFASEEEIFSGVPFLSLGFGFTREGRWRSKSLPSEGALALDDRYLPGQAGLREAIAALAGRGGLILCDFERPPAPVLLRLLEALRGQDTAVPPAYRCAPHRRILIGPYCPGRSFSRWLAEQRRSCGEIILDGAPIRHRAVPGCPAVPYAGPLPDRGLACPGAGCLYARAPDGAFLFWDSRQTLWARLAAAEVPAVILAAEWNALPEE